VVFEVEDGGGVGDSGDGGDAIAEVNADEGGGEDAESEEPLEDAGAFAAGRGGEAFGQVKWHDDADDAAADALQEAAEEERTVTVREGDHGDANDEGEAAEDHERLAAEKVGEHAGEQGGDDTAEEDGGNDDGKLARVEAGGGFEIRERATDDADVDAIKQAAESGDKEQKTVIRQQFIFDGHFSQDSKSAEIAILASMTNRRFFVKTGLGAWAATVASLDAEAVQARPRLGVVVGVAGEETPDQAIAKVKAFGLTCCQVGVGMAPTSLAEPLKAALAKYGVEATAAMTLGKGKMVWDFYQGPLTIGLVPPQTRAARMDALKRASDLAKLCGIKAVHTHCGFIPENPNEALYGEAVKAIHEVASYCRANGQTFLMETGQETPVTLLRAIQDVGLDNVGVNLDTANLILYGKGDPVAALDVIGKYVRGLHAKDGLYPTDPKNLGEEVAIGKGKVDFAEVMRKLRRLDYAGPITIEREISGPRQEEDIRASVKYLQGLIDGAYGRG